MLWEVSRRKNYDMNDECHKEEFLVLCAAENLMCDAFHCKYLGMMGQLNTIGSISI